MSEDILQVATPGGLANSTPNSQATTAHKEIPGESGLWVFLFGDMAIFLVFFASFLVARAEDRELFAGSRRAVGMTIGVVNTLILLTSSLLVVMAVNALRSGQKKTARLSILGAFACGLAFVCLKITEYTHLIHGGHAPGSNEYFNYFFILTGIHLIHVFIGFVTLFIIMNQTRAHVELNAKRINAAVSCGCYWHLVDLLWMVIFPLLYILA